MSAFKDAVARDVTDTFINLDEFAEAHDINHEQVACIIDKDVTQPSTVSSASNRLEGVFTNTVTVYVREGDLTAQPVKGEIISIDDSMHLVQSVSVEMGVLVIVAEESEQ